VCHLHFHTFFLFGASRFLFVSALIFLSSASFIVFSYQCKFVSIRSLSSSPMVYNFFSFHLFICLFSYIGEGFFDASFSLLFMLSCFLPFSTSLHCLFCAIVSSFRVLFLLHHWFIYFFFRFSYLFVFLYWRRSPASLPAV